MNLLKTLGIIEEPATQQLTLYIPNKDKNGKVIKNIRKWIKEAQKVLTIIGGGTTMLPPADGTWLNPEKNIISIKGLKDKDIVWEKTVIIYTYIDPDRFEENTYTLREFLHRFGRETNQGETAFEFDGRFYKISKFDPK